MRFYRELLESTGLASKSKEVSVGIAGFSFLAGLLAHLVFGVIGLSISIAILAFAATLEALRVIAQSRQQRFEALWPQVFESFQNASQSSISLTEQLHYMATSGPLPLRGPFVSLANNLEAGMNLQHALSSFRSSIGSRHADFLSFLIELSTELGGNGMSETWEKSALQLRSEQKLLGEVLAKQGWVLGSAKVALLAPWLIAIVLLQLPQNLAAFRSDLGVLVLFGGLLVSMLAYTLVNKIGVLPKPQRLFYVD